MNPEELVFWHWWVLGVALLVLEAFAPGAIFLWLGISAGVVGLLLLIVPVMGWEMQVLIFSVLSVVSVVTWKKLRPVPPESDRPTLNRRGEGYIGRNFTLQEPIVNGVGKLRVDDTIWRVSSGTDSPAGRKVKVTGVDGTTLKVELEP